VSRVCRLIRAEAGFSLIELMVAVTFVASGAMALASTLEASRALVTLSERKEAAAHVGQQEMERIHSLPYAQVALTSTPSHSADPVHPAYYVTNGTPSTYRYSQPAGASEPLVTDATNGTLAAVTTWSDGRLSGELHRFVTSVDDATADGGAIDGSENYRRVTLAITVSGAGGPKKPTLVSSLVRDAGDGDENPLANPQTTCRDSAGQTVSCWRGIGRSSSRAWFLYDTPASAGTRQAIVADHPTHTTVGAGASPDLLGETAPPDASPLPPLRDYSSEIAGDYAGGRALLRGATCAQAPSDDPKRSAYWVSPPLAAATTLTGEGGLTVYTQSLGGVSGEGTLCAAFYRAPNGLADTPVQLGRASYGPAQWNEALGRVSFSFDFAPTDVTVGVGERVGVRLWASQGADLDLVLAYDHPTYRSSLQLNVTGGTPPSGGDPPCAGCSY
jgi:Tfp pilus assembly protein PilV